MKSERKHAIRNKVTSVQKSSATAPRKLKLLITVVNSSKAEFYADLLQSNYEVNMQLSLVAHGTADTEMLSMLGLSVSEKTVLISIIRSDRAAEAMKTLEEKFRTVRNGKGIAYTVPLTSTIGVAIYSFLSNTHM